MYFDMNICSQKDQLIYREFFVSCSFENNCELIIQENSLIELIFNYNFNPINRFAASVDICLKRKRWQASITFPRH